MNEYPPGEIDEHRNGNSYWIRNAQSLVPRFLQWQAKQEVRSIVTFPVYSVDCRFSQSIYSDFILCAPSCFLFSFHEAVRIYFVNFHFIHASLETTSASRNMILNRLPRVTRISSP